jgi:hypothetical protein
LAQKFKFIEALACPFRHRAQGIFRNVDRQPGFLAQKFIEAAQQCAATCEHQSTIN